MMHSDVFRPISPYSAIAAFVRPTSTIVDTQ